MNVDKHDLKTLISNKLHAAGLKREDADIMGDVLVFAEQRGIHSHGSVRVEYYSERISKGGITIEPKINFERTGPCSAILHGDNGPGMVLCKRAMEEAITIAKESGIAVVGVRKMSHSGAISYYTKMAAEAGLVALAVCQSDPMVVPYGGADIYYGTNPISFSVPAGDKTMNFDMATSVQAWGKILDMRSRNQPIPDTWAVDKDGKATTDPHKVKGLLPISGPKGYGLMMMVDVLSGVLMGLPFGRDVSSMYADLSKGRDLGQLHIVINPKFFGDEKLFIKNIQLVMQQLDAIRPAEGFKQVMYPGEIADIEQARTDREGIDIVDDIYNYLISDKIYIHSYDHKDPFAD
ncbi:ureidoglycolate dehydrogenase [Bartonella sp. HY329]|uniref:ureidoglycolate dehydrogenase n=1 Tax=unclassified Bartonella TaxID=2645622 RepID=UPI0021CA1C50|nr:MULTISPECIES: ureidoglycolate dehydrogenase [unclassified Bartonella]UXM94980.1 ureidoglycolate dehydrogenase [Bartonella sp. HY329]UXN09303.1 ureidoglycolate dehydrogenase [Bartonella sp. HY328]